MIMIFDRNQKIILNKMFLSYLKSNFEIQNIDDD